MSQTKRKPKFQAGQIVCVREGDEPYRVEKVIRSGLSFVYDLGTLETWLEAELRHQTAREKGPR